MFDADRPIVKSSQDRLKRSVFAKYLARAVLDHTDPASMVIGLYGGFGVGKTSIINLVLEELEFAASNLEDPDKPIVLNFSAFSYSGQNQLLYSFFRRLAATLRDIPYLQNAERIIYLLELYVSFFTQKPVPRKLRPHRPFYEKLLSLDKEDAYAWESGRDLTQVKAELNELLAEQNHKIIIIIDNISRLYDYEIKQIFQIVKSIGDYANTTYILAFDKTQVIKALHHLEESHPEEYIEKIVQLPFDIPPIEYQDLEVILADRLHEVLLYVPAESWNPEYWADIYYASLKFFFENCRDITRYINTLNFSYSRLRDVVNPVDFFALTGIEVFAPKVYAGIRENKDLFTDLLDHVYILNQSQIEEDKLRCEEIITRTNRIPHDILLALFIQLFPRIRKIYKPHENFYHSDAVAYKLRKICSPDAFDAYFRLSIQADHIPKAEFDILLSLTADQTAFDQVLTRLNQDERIISFLDLFDSKIIALIPKKNIAAIILALLDNGDLFPPGIAGPLSLDTPKRIHRIIHGLLQRIEDKEERFTILQNAIAKTDKSLFSLVNEIREEGREHEEESDTFLPHEYRELTMEQLISLRKLVVSRIESWAKNESLMDHPKLLSILFAWRDWGNEEDCRHYVFTLTQTDRGLIAFLTAVLQEPINQTMTEYEKTPNGDKYLEIINQFISPTMLENHAKILFEDNYFEKLREKEQLALMIFLDLIQTPTKKIIPKTV